MKTQITKEYDLKIDGCIRCPLYLNNPREPECKHPINHNIPYYEQKSLIEVDENNIPINCPLRTTNYIQIKNIHL